MEVFAPIINVISICLNLFSIIILLWGITICAKDFFLSRFRIKDKFKQMQSLSDTKNQLGTYVLFSLEVLIVADIIDSIAKPTITDIIRLAAIVAIRTVISHFLHKEMQGPRIDPPSDSPL